MAKIARLLSQSRWAKLSDTFSSQKAVNSDIAALYWCLLSANKHSPTSICARRLSWGLFCSSEHSVLWCSEHSLKGGPQTRKRCWKGKLTHLKRWKGGIKSELGWCHGYFCLATRMRQAFIWGFESLVLIRDQMPLLVALSCHPGTQKAKAGLWVWGQTELHSQTLL